MNIAEYPGALLQKRSITLYTNALKNLQCEASPPGKLHWCSCTSYTASKVFWVHTLHIPNWRRSFHSTFKTLEILITQSVLKIKFQYTAMLEIDMSHSHISVKGQKIIVFWQMVLQQIIQHKVPVTYMFSLYVICLCCMTGQVRLTILLINKE